MTVVDLAVLEIESGMLSGYDRLLDLLDEALEELRGQ